MKKTLEALIKKEIFKRNCLHRKYDWLSNARKSQIEPQSDWAIWLILAGRGFGKTRTGAETIRMWTEKGIAKRICLLGDTMDDVKHVMIEGESGILACHPPKEMPEYLPSKRKIIWKNGTTAMCYSADAYEQLRGPQFDAAWIDELSKFQYPNKAFDQLMMGMRLVSNPRTIITSTPKPIKIIKDLLKRKDVAFTRGTTYENQDKPL